MPAGRSYEVHGSRGGIPPTTYDPNIDRYWVDFDSGAINVLTAAGWQPYEGPYANFVVGQAMAQWWQNKGPQAAVGSGFAMTPVSGVFPEGAESVSPLGAVSGAAHTAGISTTGTGIQAPPDVYTQAPSSTQGPAPDAAPTPLIGRRGPLVGQEGVLGPAPNPSQTPFADALASGTGANIGAPGAYGTPLAPTGSSPGYRGALEDFIEGNFDVAFNAFIPSRGPSPSLSGCGTSNLAMRDNIWEDWARKRWVAEPQPPPSGRSYQAYSEVRERLPLERLRIT